MAIPNNVNNEEINLNWDSPEEKKVLEKPKEKDLEFEKDREREKDKHKEKERERNKEKHKEKEREKDTRDKHRDKEREERHKKSKKHRRSHSQSLSRSRSRSLKKSKSKNRQKNNRSSSSHSQDKFRKNRRPTLKEAEVGMIYDGRVTKVHDYGCFVLLENFVPKKEGLVHISNIRDKRITNAFEAVQRNQNVKVKVIAIAGSKISLSMKEVDQETGEEIQKRPKNRLANVKLKFLYFDNCLLNRMKLKVTRTTKNGFCMGS